MRDIFNQVIEGLGDPITIKTGKVDGGSLGYTDEKTLTVVVDESLSPAQKAAVLLHEFFHVTDVALRASGVTKRRANHDWIHNAAPNLLILLVAAGIWPSLTLEEAVAVWGEAPTPEAEGEATP